MRIKRASGDIGPLSESNPKRVKIANKPDENLDNSGIIYHQEKIKIDSLIKNKMVGHETKNLEQFSLQALSHHKPEMYDNIYAKEFFENYTIFMSTFHYESGVDSKLIDFFYSKIEKLHIDEPEKQTRTHKFSKYLKDVFRDSSGKFARLVFNKVFAKFTEFIDYFEKMKIRKLIEGERKKLQVNSKSNSLAKVEIQALMNKFNLPFSINNSKSKSSINEIFEKMRKANVFDPVNDGLKQQILRYHRELKISLIPKQFVLANINNVVGNGIFLKPDAGRIEKEQFIGAYSGSFEFTSDSGDRSYTFNLTEEKQLKKLAINNEQEIIVNAEKIGNFTRFINHSKNSNAYAQVFLVGNYPQILIFAKKIINPCEQLTIDYGSNYWKYKDISPIPITSTSYRLNKHGHVEYDGADLVQTFLKKYNLPLSRDTNSKTARYALNQVRSSEMCDDKLASNIKQFESDVKKFGIPNGFTLKFLGNNPPRFALFLKSNEIKSINEGEFIAVFSGEYTMVPCNKKINEKMAYLLNENDEEILRGDDSQNIYINALNKGNFTRAIRHSPQPNAAAKQVVMKNKTHQIVIVACRKIHPGDEITLDYGHEGSDLMQTS